MPKTIPPGERASPTVIGQWIDDKRLGTGLSLNKIADLTGIRLRHLRRIRNGETKQPGPEVVEGLADVFGMTPEASHRPGL
jgi:transcriptional regulator with XRE-family HTH domain